MTGKEFYESVTSHTDLEWLGAVAGDCPAEDSVLIGNRRTKFRYQLAIDAIKNHTWDVLRALLTGEREAKIMMHITRIVGYYSQLRNWNRSKLAELRDRQRGSYGVTDTSGQARESAAA